MAVAYYIRFAVEGSGPLPVDMLRWDGCYPGDVDAVRDMVVESIQFPAKKVTIRLVHVCSDRKWTPAAERWQSFGWRVVQVQMPIAV